MVFVAGRTHSTSYLGQIGEHFFGENFLSDAHRVSRPESAISPSHTAVALHNARRLPVVAQVAEHYSHTRDRSGFRRPTADFYIPEDVVDRLKDSRVYFLPGFLCFPPSREFLDPFALTAGKGAAFVGVSNNPKMSNHGSAVMLGGAEAVFHEVWMNEVATVVARVAQDLNSYSLEDRPRHLVLLGHSKGGLLACALKAIAICYFENGKELPRNVLEFFPNLLRVPRESLEMVFQLAKDAKTIPIAAPLFGLDESLLDSFLARLFDQLFLNTSLSFRSEFIRSVFSVFGDNVQAHHYASAMVFAKRDARSPLGVVRHVRHNHGVRGALSTPILPATETFFEMLGATKMKHLVSDDLVPMPPDGIEYLEVCGNHINVVEQRAVALKILSAAL